MTKNSKRALCASYLTYYAQKNLEGVSDLFSDDIVLRDWKIRVTGKEKALKETRKNFESVNNLAIEILKLHQSQNTVIAELKINVDAEVLYVVDIITFNENDQIASIRAYLGRGDN